MPTLAKTAEEWEALSTSDDTSIVRSKDDWDKLMSRRNAAQAMAPMALIERIPDAALAKFSQGLRFVNNSLGHAEYGMLRSHLSQSEIIDLFALFGMSKQYFMDYSDHYCETGESTCYHRTDAICTSSC